jgi:reverse gyrase
LSDLQIQKEGVFIKKVLTFEEEEPEKVKNIKKENKTLIKILDKRQEQINPFPPFTTDTLLQEANDKLKLGADEVMKIAQDLFES